MQENKLEWAKIKSTKKGIEKINHKKFHEM